MLNHLSITNYAIIEKLELDFNDGFTVITGETGAGKSILMGALSLILGKRADTAVLNNKLKKCIVEGEFNLEKGKYLNFFDSNELDYEELTIIRREISSSGKSRAFINDTPVSLTVLRDLTSQLIDIHSQHQSLQVQDQKFQIKVLDSFAGLEDKVEVYSKKFSNYLLTKKELAELTQLFNKAKSDIDYITFQVQEIEELGLKSNEKEEIESQLELINNAEEIKSVLEKSGNDLMNSDQNLLLSLKNTANMFAGISERSDNFMGIYNRLLSLCLELEDVSREIDIENNGLNFNNENLNHLNDRLSKIYTIEQKHNLSSTKEILQLLGQLKLQLDDTNASEDSIIKLSQLVEEQKNELLKIAIEITLERKANFTGLTSKILASLNLLGMPDASFEVKLQSLEELIENGQDKIQFLFSSNKGVLPKELHKTASGGELSRLMLTIKSILASNNNLSSIIFDEIDAGVSGDIADKMASIMKHMSSNMQVIAITHLPQVAAKGETHLKIYKENKKDKTLTSIILLNKIGRIEELAKMLSGKDLSDAARQNAKNLLDV